MNPTLLTQLARLAKQDGLTLTWCLIHLSELLESQGPAINADSKIDREALALLLMAVIKAYPSGADVGSIETLF